MTLMETVVSCFVLCLVMLALFNLFPSSMYALKRGECQILAEQEAQTWVEIYRAESFDSLTPGGAPITLPTRSVNGVVYNPVLSIFTPAGTRADLVKGLRVTVSWTFQSVTRNIQREVWVSKLKSE